MIHAHALENLHWQLSVLSKAVHYKNLSGAAAHVGLSQPQLSRIISRLESELNVVLLDRTVRRKSGWTPVAYKIAEAYNRSSRKLSQALLQLQSENQVTQLTIGILEGLIPLASAFCHELFARTNLHVAEINVLDLSELEERFEKEELDIIFTCREPGRHKYRNIRSLGFQAVEKTGDGKTFKVLSPFEYANLANRRSLAKDARVVISNSLAVRRLWIERFGAEGYVPSEVRREALGGDSEVPVYLIATEVLSPSIWAKIESVRV